MPLALPLIHALAPDVDLLRGWTLLAGALAMTALLAWLTPATAARPRTAGGRTESLAGHARAEKLLSLFLFLSLLILYLVTLAPAVGEADTFEFQVGIARLGIAHGSGYPLLMLVGKVFSLLPLGGTLAWRANLTSAFFGALAGVLAARLARRLGAGLVPALLAGLAFGVSPTLWSRAVEVEAYTLNAALVAAILFLAVDMAQTHSLRRLPLLAFLFGLSLTNHLTTLLLAPAIVFSVFIAARKAREGEGVKERGRGQSREAVVGRLSSAVLALLLGLSVYLYLPLRWPAVNNGERLSLAQFANILSGNEAKGAFQWDLPLRDPGRYVIVFDKIQGEYGWVGVAALAYSLVLLAYAGWRRLRDRRPNGRRAAQLPVTNYLLPLLFLAYIPYLYFALAFNVPDPDFSAFLIPLHLIAAVLMGLALQSLFAFTTHRLSQTTDHQPRTTAHYLLLTAFCLLPLSSIWQTLPRVDQSDDWERYRLGEQILGQPLAEGATILADSQKIAPLYYLQVAEGVRPDLDIIVLPDEASYRAVLDERIAQGRTVYLGRYLPGLGGGYALRSVGPLAEVSTTPAMEAPLALAPAAQQPAVAGLKLLGYASDEAGLTAAAPDDLPVTLAWQADAALEENLLVSLQFTGEDGTVAWRGPGRVPVGGLYPTNAWRAGEVVTDYHAIPIGQHMPPGRYRLEVGLFPPFAVTDAGWTEVGEVTVTAPSETAQPTHPLRASFGNDWLLGYDLAETAAPGSPVDMTLYWLRSATAEQAITVLGETRSLDAWPPGSVVAQRYAVPAPATGDRLEITLATGQPARCGWLAPTGTGCALPPVRLAGQAAAEGARNFSNEILLSRATLETPSAAPGGQVRVTLEWQGLRRMSEDYTVFVHLLGPDGLVHGQVDAWPASGTQATSSWVPGQAVRDPYTIQVPADAPPGEYVVEIGLYLLSTGQRLPLLNEAGEVIEDRILLEELVIGN